MGANSELKNLIEGEDVHFAYCPERFVPGDSEHGSEKFHA